MLGMCRGNSCPIKALSGSDGILPHVVRDPPASAGGFYWAGYRCPIKALSGSDGICVPSVLSGPTRAPVAFSWSWATAPEPFLPSCVESDLWRGTFQALLHHG